MEFTICVNGSLKTLDDVYNPWRNQSFNNTLIDVYSIQWESEQLLRIGKIMKKLVQRKMTEFLSVQFIQGTLSATVASTIILPALILSKIDNLDNSWSTLKEKSAIAGEELALALIDINIVGYRPVNLIGYGMGSLVIFHCLQSLFLAGEFHRVQDVILLGSPLLTKSVLNTSSEPREKWQRARVVVSGRFINGYSSFDWILGFMFRFMEWGMHVAGLHPVELIGIEDVDLSNFIKTQNDYAENMQNILNYLDIYI